MVERWEFKIQRESGEKRGGRLTKVRWCMRNLVYRVVDLSGKWDEGRKRETRCNGKEGWWKKRDRREGKGRVGLIDGL